MVSRDCDLTVYGQKHVKINFDKVQMRLLFKITFLIFNCTDLWNLLIKIAKWESLGMAILSFIICYPMHIVTLTVKIK